VRFAGLGYLHRHGRLEEAGLPANHPALVKARDWMLSKQVLGRATGK